MDLPDAGHFLTLSQPDALLSLVCEAVGAQAQAPDCRWIRQGKEICDLLHD